MKYLTHYTKLNTLLNYILDENKLLLNNISKTNDPFEYTKRLSSVGGSKDYGRKVTSKALRMISDIIEKNIRVGCFVSESVVESNDFTNLKSIVNAPMWAYYGDNHNGAAIVFDKELLIKSCENLINYEWAIHSDSITYNEYLQFLNKHPNNLYLDDVDIDSDISIAESIFKRANKFWFNKDPKWSFEEEYRIMIFTESENQSKIDLSNCIKAIVLGNKVSDFFINAIEKSLKPMGIKCLRISFDYSLNMIVGKVA